MPDIDSELLANLRQAKKKPMFFAFIAKGGEGKLLVDKKKIPKKDIAEAKKACGGGIIYSGNCLDEEGTLVFETKKDPPGNLAAAIKKTIKSDAGLTMPVKARSNAGLEDEESETESVETAPQDTATVPSAPPPPGASAAPASPAPPPPDAGAAVMKRLNGLTAGIKAAMAGTQAARVQTLFVSANGLIKSKEFDKANAAVDELELFLKAAAVAPSAPPPPAADGAARVEARLKALAPVLQKIEAIKSPQVKDVQQAVKEANAFLAKKNYDSANETLDIAESMIKEVLTAAAKAKPGEGAAPAAKDGAAAGGGLNAALAKWSAARATVIGQLDKLNAALQAEKHPDAAEAIIELRAIRANLTAKPDTAQTVAELERYLETDDVVADADESNRFGIEVNIQVPLLEALDEIKLNLPA